MTEVPHMDEDEVNSHHDAPAADRANVDRAEAARKEREGERKVFVGTGFFWGLVFGVLITVLVIIFAAQNTASTEVRFLGWEFATPIIVLILGSVLAGVIIDEVAGLIYRRRKRRILNEREELKRLRQKTGNQPA